MRMTALASGSYTKELGLSYTVGLLSCLGKAVVLQPFPGSKALPVLLAQGPQFGAVRY